MQILPISTGRYPSTGDIPAVVLPPNLEDLSKILRISALRLNCMASLVELYKTPEGLKEAVETLESIAQFYDCNSQNNQ